MNFGKAFLSSVPGHWRGCAIVAVIVTQNLVKHYDQRQALNGVTLRVEQGEVFGLLGQNGAGKTTLVKILLGIAKPSSGLAHLLGLPAGTAWVRRRVGYLPEDHRFPDYHTGFSLLDYYGQLLSIRRKERRRLIVRSLERAGLHLRQHAKIRTYSNGMRQRLGIAQALFHDPLVIFLDEPTDGVDPVGRREMLDLLLQLKADGKTVFLNSHVLGEVERVCDRVAILQRGEVLCEGEVASLTRRQGVFVLGVAPGQDLPHEEMERHGFTVKRKGEFWEGQILQGQNLDSLIDLLRAHGVSIRHLVEKKQSLEDLFLERVLPGKLARKYLSAFSVAAR